MFFAEVFGDEAFSFFEDAVEVGEAGEAAFEGDLADGGGGVDEETGGVADADVVQVVDEGDAGLGLKETAECGFGHLNEIGGFGETDGAAEIFVDEVDDLLDPLAIVVDQFGVIGYIFAEGAGVGRERKLVEDGHQLEHGVEPFLFRQGFEPGRDAFDGPARERDAFERALEKTTDKIQLIALQEDLMKQVAVELDRELVDLFAFAFMGKPGVRNIGPHQYQLQVIDLLHAAADDTTDTRRIFDEIQLVFLMVMYREIEFRLVPGIQGEAISFCERWTFFEDRCGHTLKIKIGFFCGCCQNIANPHERDQGTTR